MEPLVWKSSEMGLWMDQVITASSNTTFSLSFAAGMEVAWTGCGGNKTAPQSMSQMWTCVIWTHSLAQGWSAEDPSAELTGLPAHLICRHWTTVCGAISRARSHYVHAHSKSCYSNNRYRDVIIICALQVYNPWPPNLDALEGNLRREVAALDPAMIRRAILDMRVRANKCIDNNGGHFENWSLGVQSLSETG